MGGEKNQTWRNRIRRVLMFVLAALGVLLVLVSSTPLVSWWAGKLAGPWTDPQGEVLIVLSGSAGADGVIGYGTYLRSYYAVLAYREGSFRSVVLSGGGQPTPQALAMRDFLECQGIPQKALILETRANSTRESALYLKELLQGVTGRKVLLTSDYHMLRARRAFQKVGLEVIPRPFPDVRKEASTWRGRWPGFLELVVEMVKIGYYWAQGWI